MYTYEPISGNPNPSFSEEECEWLDNGRLSQAQIALIGSCVWSTSTKDQEELSWPKQPGESFSYDSEAIGRLADAIVCTLKYKCRDGEEYIPVSENEILDWYLRFHLALILKKMQRGNMKIKIEKEN